MPYGVAMSRTSGAARDRSPRAVRRLGAALPLLLPVVLALAVTVALAGCGTSAPTGSPSSDAPAGATDCRAQWQQVADGLAGRDQQVDPSDLADRWTAVLATAQYYATSATAADCGAALADQQDTVREIQAWSAQLRRYDIPYRFGALAPVATDYLLAPAPTNGAGTNGAGTKAAKVPPTKKQVQAALTTLQNTATLATTDMQAGWDEATAVDLGDPAAVRHTLDDLAFLAGDSAPYQTCAAALAVLEQAKAL